MKKLTLAVLTALALTATISNTAEAKTYKNTKDIDKVSKQLYKTNLKSYRDKTKTLILNKKTYNKLKKSNKWQGLSGIKAMKSYVKKRYPGVPSNKIQAKCKFSVNYTKKENSGRYKVTLTISDELARVWWMDTHPEPEDDYNSSTGNENQKPGNETPTPQKPTQTQQSAAEEAREEYLELHKDGAEILAQVQARIDKYESIFDCKANDFEKAAIVAGWVDEHVDYTSGDPRGDVLAGTKLGDCNTFSCMNTDIGKCFGLDVTDISGGNHRWNILTVDGVRYEYDATDAGTTQMLFREISHGKQAVYNVDEFGGNIAGITGPDLTDAVFNYASENSSIKQDIYVEGLYYLCYKSYWVTETAQQKGYYYEQANRKNYYINDYAQDIKVLPALTDNQLMQYLVE